MATRVRWRNKIFDPQSVAMLKEVESRSGITVVPTQGSYSSGSLSAGTHSGPGAVDLSTRGLTKAQIDHLTKWMRKVGYSAWYRSPSDGFDPHIHGIVNDLYGLPPIAYRQTISLKNGKNGLASNLRDRQYYLNVPWTNWKKYNASKVVNRGTWEDRITDGIKMSAVSRGKKNPDVQAFQWSVRNFLWKSGINPNQFNPTGSTGYYGSETARLVSEAYKVLGRSDSRWLSADTDNPTNTFAGRVGIKYL